MLRAWETYHIIIIIAIFAVRPLELLLPEGCCAGDSDGFFKGGGSIAKDLFDVAHGFLDLVFLGTTKNTVSGKTDVSVFLRNPLSSSLCLQ